MPAPDRRTARIVGWLFIGTFVLSIPGYLIYGPVLHQPDYVLGAGHDIRIARSRDRRLLVACSTAPVLARWRTLRADSLRCRTEIPSGPQR
jgi:hypothetical protein